MTTSLPRLAVLTDRAQTTRSLVDTVRGAVDAGCRLVVLREKDLPTVERAELAARIAPVVHDADGLLLSAGELLVGCDGVHLPRPGRARRPVASAGIVGQSCHDAAELRSARRSRPAGAGGYVTLSPVFASASKPGYGPPLGPTGLAGLVGATDLPVFALGGVETPERVAACLAAGAHGVAVMGAVMRAGDPGAVVAGLLAAIEGADPTPSIGDAARSAPDTRRPATPTVRPNPTGSTT